ncbi:hypothetical protein [Aeromonas veronii]|uniref:hypothetical protein n=1 Tax=Aeromonas veronii TaxID=654 RepID=UPI0038E6C501
MGKISFVIDDRLEAEFYSALEILGVKSEDFFLNAIEEVISESSLINTHPFANRCIDDISVNNILNKEIASTLLFDNSEWDKVVEVKRDTEVLRDLIKPKDKPTMRTDDISIAQVFSDVLTSKKGMVKLVRSNGEDFVFSAKNVSNVLKCEKGYRHNDIYEVINFLKETNSHSKPEYAVVVLGGRYKGQGNILVCQDYDYVYKKIEEAKHIAICIGEKDTGVFF